MGLDIKEFKGKDMVKGEKNYVGNPDAIRESEKKRFRDPKLVDKVIELEKQKLEFENIATNKRAEINAIKKEIGAKKKVDKTDPCTEELERKAKIEQDIVNLEVQEKEAIVQRDIELGKVGNLVHETVPVFQDEDDNVNEFEWGTEKIDKDWKITEEYGFAHHHQVLTAIDGYDPLRGKKVAGHRGYYLKGPGFLLNQALVSYGMQFLAQRGYCPIQPPFFMKKEAMAMTAQLSDFDEQLYQVSTKSSTKNKENNEKEEETKEPENKDQKANEEAQESRQEHYLIATSEQPISAMHAREWLPVDEPLKYAGYSTNFRKEAGKAGKETWGVFRVHQFEKIEQFIICKPEDSWKHHKEMVETAQDFLKSLELPFRTMNIVSGALNDAAAKKYDIEAWFPGYGEYKELMSVSNCTDYQSRALEVRYGMSKKKDEKIKSFVHMLNGTLCATERTMTCILENYQEKEGVRVPKVLVPFVGTDFIKYTKPIVKIKDLEKQ